jgi:signal transduction histidine kinase
MDIKKFLFKTNVIDVEKALPDAIVFCSKDGKIQWVNDKAAEIFETSKMHLLTSNISEFIENSLNFAKVAMLNDTVIIVKLVSKDIYFDMTAKEVDEGYVMSFRDIKKTSDTVSLPKEEDAFKSINREKNAFLLKLTNDLKSPLQSIVGFAQAMSDGLGGNMSEQQEKYIRIIKKNSSELMYFITKLLELSQTEIESKSVDNKVFDVVNTVNSVVKFNEQLYKGKEIHWCIDVEEGVKNTITSDETIVKNILQNIIDVILKSVDMGDILVNLSIPAEELLRNKELNGGEYLKISLSSTSRLLSEKDLDCMFDPYMIVDNTNRKNLLRAMTLACVKNLVQTINGYVWVESTILKNTSFNILIPLNNVK